MRCDACGGDAVVFEVPDELRECAPEEAPTVAICPACLTVAPARDAVVQDADAADGSASIHDAFPADPDAATGVALLLGLLESLVLNKAEIQFLVDRLEAGGTDVFLVLDRLASDPAVDAQVDLQRRRAQLQQLVD
ncbi:hypothetical protein SAMN06269185_2618 [Natronoarchaeum philippinense]|uniref:Uncharacterized protein n=1 Tax=Natronoarchaeum philippinense TaxID=558529 RepID=A0A285P3L9_NATPI|nr:DUF6276 family protein [Natronoarchaeum philippinense]SNZ15847.1 hypothetical protein SAMN06269185_2618 [Natronoarchaeum philippinense]